MCVRMVVRARFLVGFACQFSRANRRAMVKLWENVGRWRGGKKFGLFQGDEGGWGREWLR